MQIATPRLSLRMVTPADRDDLIALERDPDVMRYINGGRPTPEDGVDANVEFHMPRGAERDVWSAFETGTGRFIGWFSLRSVGEHEAELGYRLRRDAWGKGFAAEGAHALLRHGFAQLGLRRVLARTMAVNRASRRIMEKIGLKHQRTVFETWNDPLPGSELGDVEYAIARNEWNGSEL